jgi:hypothetical protein
MASSSVSVDTLLERTSADSGSLATHRDVWTPPRGGAWPEREQPRGRTDSAEQASDPTAADLSSSDSVEIAPISPDQAVS